RRHFFLLFTMKGNSPVFLGLWLARHNFRDRSYLAVGIFFLFLLLLCFYLSLLALIYPERVFYHSSLLALLFSCYLLIAQYGIVEYRKLFETRGVHLFLTAPISRSHFLLGYFFSLLFLIGGFFLLASLLLCAIFFLFYRNLFLPFLGSLVLQFGEIVLLIFGALFLANLFTSSTVGIFAYTAFLIMGNLVGDAYREVAQGASFWMTRILSVLVYLLPMLDHYRPLGVFGSPRILTALDALLLLFYTAGFSLLFLFLSMLLLVNRPIE
ncbi:MAG: hypothetical protein ACK4G3_04760, partial [bacterium]